MTKVTIEVGSWDGKRKVRFTERLLAVDYEDSPLQLYRSEKGKLLLYVINPEDDEEPCQYIVYDTIEGLRQRRLTTSMMIHRLWHRYMRLWVRLSTLRCDIAVGF